MRAGQSDRSSSFRERDKMRRVLIVLAWVVALVVLGYTGAGIYGAVTGNEKAPAAQVEHGGPPVKAVSPQVSARPQTIRPGTWRVGTDVKAGKYRTGGALPSEIPMCYWDVRAGSETGDFLDQGVTKVDEPGLVTLKNGQYFKTSGCEDWYVTKS